MTLAYVISAYKNPAQLVRLVHRLRTGRTRFFLHVDRRTDRRTYRAMREGLRDLPDVSFLPRHRSAWGGFGHVAASLKGIAAALDGGPVDYVILLTGQDYPIKPNAEIEAFFQARAGLSFMDHSPLPTEHWTGGGLDRIDRWHVRLLGRHLSFPRRPGGLVRRRWPSGLRPYGGSSYWCLARPCLEYVRRFVAEHPRVVRFFRFVDVPDELFFQTILLSSPLARTIVNDDLRFIEWRDPDAGSPTILGAADFPRLAASTKLFARKFDVAIDERILHRLDRHLLAAEGARQDA
jgi:hypothetical protein